MAKSKHDAAPPPPPSDFGTIPDWDPTPTPPAPLPFSSLAEPAPPVAPRARFRVHAVELKLEGDGYKLVTIRLVPSDPTAPVELKSGDEVTVEVVPPASAPAEG